MKKKTRIDLLKISVDLTIATLNKQNDEFSDEQIIELFEKCYLAITKRFHELEKAKKTKLV